MNKLSDDSSTVLGDWPGALTGSPQLIQGVHGNAVRLNGVDEFIDYGPNTDLPLCLLNLNENTCASGRCKE